MRGDARVSGREGDGLAVGWCVGSCSTFYIRRTWKTLRNTDFLRGDSTVFFLRVVETVNSLAPRPLLVRRDRSGRRSSRRIFAEGARASRPRAAMQHAIYCHAGKRFPTPVLPAPLLAVRGRAAGGARGVVDRVPAAMLVFLSEVRFMASSHLTDEPMGLQRSLTRRPCGQWRVAVIQRRSFDQISYTDASAASPGSHPRRVWHCGSPRVMCECWTLVHEAAWSQRKTPMRLAIKRNDAVQPHRSRFLMYG